MAHTTRATITTTPTTKKIRSPRLSRPGCIALKPTSRLGEPVDLAEPGLRQPRDVLADGGGERPGLGLVSAGPQRDLASLRVEDRHAPTHPLAVADLDREAVPVVDLLRRRHDPAPGGPSSRSRCPRISPSTDSMASRKAGGGGGV